MRKFFVSFLILAVLSLSTQLAFAELPSWVTADYSEDDYLFLPVDSDADSVINGAKKELIQKIFKNANALFNPDAEQPAHKWVSAEEQRSLEQEYATALINLDYMKAEHSHLAQHFQTVAAPSGASNSGNYRLVNVKRRELMRQYVNREQQLRERINVHLARAAQMEAMNQQKAAAAYMQTYALYEQLKEALLIQQAVAPPQSQDMAAGYRKLMEPIAGTNDGSLRMPLPEVHQRVNHLQYQGRMRNTVTGVAESIAQQLSIQTEKLGGVKGDITLKGFSYKNSNIPIAQSNVFQSELKGLLEGMGWQVIIPQPNNRTLVEKVSFTVRSITWPNGAEGTGKFDTTIYDIDEGHVVAVSSVNISADLITNFRPKDAEESLENDKATAIANIQTAPKDIFTGDELRVDVWTNKGLEQPIHHEGEDVIIYCRVNKPSHIRLLFVLGDEYTLLHNNTYIDKDRVGTDVPLGDFDVVPPFGTGKLIVLAQSTEHKEIPFIRKGPRRVLDTQDVQAAMNLAFSAPERTLAEVERHAKDISVTTQPKSQ